MPFLVILPLARTHEVVRIGSAYSLDDTIIKALVLLVVSSC